MLSAQTKNGISSSCGKGKQNEWISEITNYEHFAIEYDLSRMHYWQIEKGKVNITIKTLNKILTIHNIEIEEFWKIEINTQPDLNC